MAREFDQLNFTEPPDDIPCRDCVHRLKAIRGVERYKYGNCKKYPLPGNKPMRVVWHGEDCPYHEEDPDA